jgi:Bifunctional DNA primase/polymerase, N-terminal
VCSESRVADGVDVKSDGGYAMVPPSVHPDGPTYTWANDEPIATAPDWLLALTRKQPPEPITLPPRTHIPHGAYGAAALKREIEELAATRLVAATTRSTAPASPCISLLPAANSITARSSAAC